MTFLRGSLIVCLTLVTPMLFAQSAPPAENPTPIQPEAREVVTLANQARAEAGVGRLQWDPALAEAARRHCLRMASEGPISHRYPGELDLSERASQAGAHFSLIEENIAIGPTPAEIHSEWMHSPDHRTNLLSPDVDKVGVAIVASHGVLYAVADYERAVATLTQTQVEGAIAGLLHGRGFTVLNDPADARASCAQGRRAASSKQPGFFMLWQGSDLNSLPKALTDRIASGEFHQAAVGSCAPQSGESGFSSYRVAVLLY